jgi:hypothetical protein
METTQKQRKKTGPIPKGYVLGSFTVQPELLEWAKRQPEGLSGLIRLLFATEKKRRDKEAFKG